jgi:hypothetical protein
MAARKISLKVITAPATGVILDAPPHTSGERPIFGLHLRPMRHDLATCPGEPCSQRRNSLRKLRIVQFNCRLVNKFSFQRKVGENRLGHTLCLLRPRWQRFETVAPTIRRP